MAEIKKLQVDGADIYPVTHESAVYDNEGKSIESKYLSSVTYTEGDDIKIEGSEGGSVDTSELEAQIEEVDTKVGELSKLLTTDKDNIVGAINELFQSANNGKQLIADAIGEPLNSEDTFSAMSNDINGLLSTFKSNMMNSGVTVESGDKFKQLIEKIKGLTEGEGNKGIQFATGICELTTRLVANYLGTRTVSKNILSTNDIGFVPTYLFMKLPGCQFRYNPSNITTVYTLATWIKVNEQIKGEGGYIEVNYTTEEGAIIKVVSSSSGYEITLQGGTIEWYAIGVGEEDTTLRDSLADILENKGVDVTEDDDMASLITKVDSINTGVQLPSWVDTSNYWFTCTDIPKFRYQHGSCVINNKLYILGGSDNDANTNATNYCYDIDLNSWETLDSMPTGVYNHTVEAINDKAYIIGGYSTKNTNTCFDSLTKTYSTKATFSNGRYNLSSAVIDSNLYIIGGQTTSSAYYNIIQCYDSLLDSWSTKSNMPAVLACHSSNAIGDKIYVFGGHNGMTLQGVYCYDSLLDSWSTKSNMPSGNYDHASISLHDFIYLISGYSSNSFYKYDTVNDSWNILSSDTLVKRYRHTANVFNNTIYLAGGYISGAISNSLQFCSLS